MNTSVAATGYATFDTPIGVCGVAWGNAGLVGVQLPEGDERRTRVRLARRFRSAGLLEPPVVVQRAIAGITDLLAGSGPDLRDVVLDMHGVPHFNRRVYDLARTIGPGHTATYGELAARLGNPGAAREVGQALGRNPFPIVVPCHRVLAAGGRLGGFSATGGVDTKRRLLLIEGAPAAAQLALFQEGAGSVSTPSFPPVG